MRDEELDRWAPWTRLVRWELADPEEQEADDQELMDCDHPEEDPTEGTYDPMTGEDEIPF